MNEMEIKNNLKELDDRVTQLEYNEIKRDDRIVTLCEKMDEVISMGKKITGLFLTSFVTAFFTLLVYFIETHIK